MAIISNFPSGSVTGVKGDAETAYRAGKVNLTPEDIGAYSKSEVDARLNASVLDHTVYLPSLFSVAGHTAALQTQ